MLDDEGYLFLRGRSRDVIIRGGVNIYPLEIESVLLNHPAIAEVAVIGVPSTDFGEEVGAFIRLHAPLTTEEVKAWCRREMTPYKVPSHVHFIDEFPYNSSGKILKSELAKRLS